MGFASGEVGGDDGWASKSIRAGFAWPRSQGRKEALSHSESHPLPCAAGVVSREAKWLRRRSWFWVAIVVLQGGGLERSLWWMEDAGEKRGIANGWVLTTGEDGVGMGRVPRAQHHLIFGVWEAS